jgi:hypothetical protein
MKKIFLIVATCIISTVAKAQGPTFQWAKTIGGTANEYGYATAVDASGNVYYTGSFRTTVDFDPGPGTFNLTSAGGDDIFISKLDASGNFLWAKRIGWIAADIGNGITLDASGNVFITGYFRATLVDFDPGAGTFNLYGDGLDDIFILKLDALGNFVWAVNMGGPGSDHGNAIGLDASGNVYSTGSFSGTADFDPSATTYNLTSSTPNDIYISKLDATGSFIWAKKMGGSSIIDSGTDIALDALGNVYTTGSFGATVDFDPGAGTYNLTALGSIDVFVSKLDASGNFVWAKQFGGSGGDHGEGLTLDAAGNVYTTGDFQTTADFDPGAATFNLTSAGSWDIFVSKLDASGNFVWAKGMGSPGGDHGLDIAVDAANNVFSTGSFSQTADFDPGPGVNNITTVGSDDIFISKLDASGNFGWAKSIGSTGQDFGFSISLDAGGSIYTTGSFSLTADFDPGPGTYNLTSVGIEDIFVSKLCAPLAQPGAISGSTSMCSGAGANTYSIAVIPGATSYVWTLPGGWSGSSSTNTISATPGTTGIFTVTASNACGVSPQQTLQITVDPTPTISIASGVICPVGGSFTLSPTGANTYTYLNGGPVVSPAVTTVYTVVGTSTAGCVSQNAMATVTVANSLTVTISGNNTVCSGSPINLAAGGANTYTWSTSAQTNTIAPTPTANTTYSVIGAGGSCTNSAQLSVTVNPVPNFTITSSHSIACTGQQFTLSSSDASLPSYTWASVSSTVSGSSNDKRITNLSITTTFTLTGQAANGCTNIALYTQNVSPCTSIASFAPRKNEMIIYPNPTNGKITIVSIQKERAISIFNSLGQLIYSAEMKEEKIEVDLSKMAKGIYFVRTGTETKKIIKE